MYEMKIKLHKENLESSARQEPNIFETSIEHEQEEG